MIKFFFHSGTVSVTSFRMNLHRIYLTLYEVKSLKKEKAEASSSVAADDDMVDRANALIVIEYIYRPVCEHFAVL